MSQMKNLSPTEMLEQYPNFDEAWGTAWGEMWLVAHILHNADMMTPIVKASVDMVFDALDAILHHYDNKEDDNEIV